MYGYRRFMMHGHGCGFGVESGRMAGSGMGRMQGSMCGRGFLTNKEKVEWLREYAEELEKEAKGVQDRIKELEKAS